MVPAESLATMVQTKSIYAKRYINMILGKVHMCERIDDLKKYDVSITANCMRYQNHVASAIRPSIYEQPFIGQNAVRIQLEQAKQKQSILKESEDKQKTIQKKIQQTQNLLKTSDDVDIKYRIHILPELQRTELAIAQCQNEIDSLQQNSTMIGKQIRAEELQTECETIQHNISKKDREIGAFMQSITSKEESIQNATEQKVFQENEVTDIMAKDSEEAVLWQKEYIKQTEDKTFVQFQSNFDRRKKANLTSRENALGKMTTSMVDYKTSFDFGAAATFETYPEYAAIYDRLVHSELLSYEEKVTKARMSAEEEFREQFLSKLQENMKQAQSEFKELNKALKDITFCNEQYEFLYLPSKTYNKYYEMIMDDFNVGQGQSLFSGLFHENHKPLQIIIAAPPDKIQYIGPKMQETLLVLTDNKLSFVEEYRYDIAREEITE